MRFVCATFVVLALLPMAALVQSSAGEMSRSPAVVVYRGSAMAPAYLTAPKAELAPAAATIAVAGRQVWLVDPVAERLTACELRRTSTIGRSMIACTARTLPTD